MMFDAAKKHMEEIGSEFIISGEILGQRPMSQHGQALGVIEKDSDLKGKIVRPLSAGLLPPTIPENDGLIRREDMGTIKGRSKKIQLQMAKARAAMIPAEDRTLVVLALDEFQKIHDLTLLSTLLAQARSYNLGLILSHQNTSQISSKLLESIAGNTATQIFGRVSGIDAERIAKIMDPMFADMLTKQIPVQSDRVFTAKMRDVDNEQSTPLQFTVRDEPLLLSSIDEVKTLFESRDDRVEEYIDPQD